MSWRAPTSSDEPVYASLAPAQGRLLIRGQSHIYRINSA